MTEPGPLRVRDDAGLREADAWPAAPEPLPSPVIDNHCHLDIAPSAGWLPVAEALAAAHAVNVTQIVQVGCDVQGSEWAVEVAQRYEQIVAAVALHPNEAPRVDLDDALARLKDLASADRVRAIGETGLDYFRTDESGRAAQHDSFRRHIALAKALDKTLMIHDRDAHEDVVRLLDDAGAPERVVMHCFSGDADFAAECLRRGFYLSFSGTVTFKNARDLRAALAVAPLERILVETDAPYLTPTPYRGKPNASYLVPMTVRLMAQEKGVELGEFCEQLRANTYAAYGAW